VNPGPSALVRRSPANPECAQRSDARPGNHLQTEHPRRVRVSDPGADSPVGEEVSGADRTAVGTLDERLAEHGHADPVDNSEAMPEVAEHGKVVIRP